MTSMKLIVFIFVAIVTVNSAQANVIGTEYQNFNPTYSGLDFTTVNSSETLQPCLCNIGLFFNYAKNTLTYSDSYYKTNEDLKGKRANDFLVGADLVAGFGITRNWDFGVIFPFVVTAQNEDPYGVSYFDKFGLTEVRPMTKFRFYGDNTGGLAVQLSANFSTIENNPFSGVKPGPTVNLELIGDTTTDGGTKLGWNLGYRKRSPGDPIVNPITGERPPFERFKDSWIASLAMAHPLQSLKSDLIAEIIGSHSGKMNEDDAARKAQQALELNLGLRHDWSKSTNLHGGLGTKLANAQSSPDIRAYVGINFNFGPLCDSKPARVDYPTAVVDNVPVGTNSQTNLSMPVSAKNIEGYRWKIGSTPRMNCRDEKGYSEEIPGNMTIDTDIVAIPDGGITLCALAKNSDGIWQPLSKPTIYQWIKSRQTLKSAAPVAVVKNHPVGESAQTELNMPISAINPMDYAAYRWKIGPVSDIDCREDIGYSDEIAGSTPAMTTIKDIPDGEIVMCALAKNTAGVWQPVTRPTIVSWYKVSKAAPPIQVEQKKGYELFRLSASVLFDFDKNDIRPQAQPELDKIDRYLKLKPYKRVIIEGHTDSKGTDEYNDRLSQRRANEVRRWMIEKYGVDGSKFQAVGKGEKFPVDTNETDQGRQNNRRVEFKIYR